MSQIGSNLADRFWLHVTKTDDCWIFGDPSVTDRYHGIRLNSNGDRKGAHIVSWFLHYGVWPNLNVLHTCDRKACIRPDHLFEGDQVINMQDAKSKGRTRGGRPRDKYKGKFLRFSLGEVSSIRSRIASGERLKDIAQSLGCSHAIISYIRNGRRGYPYQPHRDDRRES